ncbi:hypothetical protein O3P69_019102 [Scylla paramamosain]|uniref:T-complex protein 1 subunit gamma n=1 Tax=Scylla paramamosain TaxID=85552 RepID=A0AAW0SCX5_SCYPA
MIADVIRTCLGPRSMLKMLMDPMGGVVMTNDGNAILREITVQHPAAKHMIEIARTQDEEVGGGTSSVVILAGEMLAVAEQYLEQNMHPLIIIQAYRQALDHALEALKDTLSVPIDINDDTQMTEVIKSCIGTKFLGQYGDLACGMALRGRRTVATTGESGRRGDRRSRNGPGLRRPPTDPPNPPQIPGGAIEESCLLQIEEEHVKELCADILALRPDVVITEKGVSDLAQHYLVKAGVTCLRRVKKSDNNRLARACGATICNRTEELKESDVGTQAGLFEVKKIGDEYFTFITKCQDPKACTVLLRGPSKDILNEVERNLQDALGVAWNLALERGVRQWPYSALAQALEVIPRTLAQNCGANIIRVLTALRAKHASGATSWGVDGEMGELADMNKLKIWEPLAVKEQVYKTAVETAVLLLRIDDIVSGSKKAKDGGEGAQLPPNMGGME